MTNRPTDLPEWASTLVTDPITGNDNKEKPPENLLNFGWGVSDYVARQDINYMLDLLSTWINYLDENKNKAASFTVATLPNAGTRGAGSFIYVSDAAGGSCIAFSDGTTWRRISDRTVIN